MFSYCFVPAFLSIAVSSIVGFWSKIVIEHDRLVSADRVDKELKASRLQIRLNETNIVNSFLERLRHLDITGHMDIVCDFAKGTYEEINAHASPIRSVLYHIEAKIWGCVYVEAGATNPVKTIVDYLTGFEMNTSQVMFDAYGDLTLKIEGLRAQVKDNLFIGIFDHLTQIVDLLVSAIVAANHFGNTIRDVENTDDDDMYCYWVKTVMHNQGIIIRDIRKALTEVHVAVVDEDWLAKKFDNAYHYLDIIENAYTHKDLPQLEVDL